ncbi:MAG: type II secretion system F family protein [Planctomycetaceae bacterium]|nr:type II secretion system F family protein [Planctomycetaceae bacterium]
MAKPNFKQLQDWFHRLSLLYRTGIDLRTAVGQIRQSATGRAHEVWAAIEADLMQGHTLYDAMRRQGAYFPQLSLALVEAGERGGRLEQATERLSFYYKGLIETRKSFLASIAWPAFELGMAIFILGALILIMGFVSSITGTPPLDLFGFGWSIRQYFIVYCALVVALCGGVVVMYQSVARGWWGTWPLDIARRVPLLGRTIEMMALTRTAWALATAYEAGISATDSLKIGLRSTQQWYYQRHHNNAEAGIRQGRTLAQVMRQTEAFPLDFVQAIETGELTGTIPESMEHLSRRYDDEIQRNLRTLSTIGGVLIMLLIFVSLGFLIIYLYYNIYFKPLMELGRGF